MHTIAVLAVVFATSFLTSVALRRNLSRDFLTKSAPQTAVAATCVFAWAQLGGLGWLVATILAAAVTGYGLDLAKFQELTSPQGKATATYRDHVAAPRARATHSIR